MEKLDSEKKMTTQPETENTSPESLESEVVIPAKNQTKEPGDGFKPKRILFFLTLFVVVAMFFSIKGWFNSLKLPFSNYTQTGVDLNANSSITNSDLSQLLDLQDKDTDLDRLSDYDELYLYKTSPYLQDTDSDGYDDYAEVQNGHDPNCPAGQVCSTTVTATNTNEASLATDLSVEDLRALLIEGGMTEDEVNALEDETIQQIYLNSLEQVEQNQSDIGSATPDIEIDLNSISSSQLRILLLDQGFEEGQLNQFSDEQLMSAWQTIIQSSQ